ncbi:MAG: homoaconitase [Deltaproteobacteria bacterium RIFOXYA12_FULL_58_15]|nr:MAG: homoaconitase [Deltaproteobacteria bacterium RIFOXYA12_FULL_58_15]
MGQTVVEKIAQGHMVRGPTGRPLVAGDFLSIRPKHILTHDNTAPVMKKFLSIGAPKVFDPKQPVFALDHDIQNESDANLAKYKSIEAFAAREGIDFYPAGTGIGHQIMCEQLYVTPGSFVVASDSHSNMYGALGAVGTPVVRTDAAAIWSTGEFWWQIPQTVQVVLHGKLPEGVGGKDLILTLCGHLNQGQVLNLAVEFAGDGVASLSMDDRMSVANMTTEWGALVGWFPMDARTVQFIQQRMGAGITRVTPPDLASMRKQPVLADLDAAYAARVTVDLSTISAHVAGPDSVQVSTSLAQLKERQIPIHKAYLLSCVNSRLEDLQAAANVLRGKKVAAGVTLYVAAASRAVQAAAEKSGAWQILVDAGATILPPSCGPCIGLGTGLLEAGENGISATNRNFKGRMGSRDAKCYLASPAVVAASALAGFISGPDVARKEPSVEFVELEATAPQRENVEILEGFPATLEGRLVFLPADNINTDGIYGKDYTYRDDMTQEMMAKVVMENYDPGFAAATRKGDVIVGGFNFGTGSSREQAVTALQAKGIALVLAGSFSQTYLRNAFNNGMACVECPPLVKHLRQRHSGAIAKDQKTIMGEDEIQIDFSKGTIAYGGESFRFPPLGSVPQALVVAGGVENQVRQTLGL